MAIQERVARVRLTNSTDANAHRELKATAAVRDTAAGLSVLITINRIDYAPGIAPAPAEATTHEVSLWVDDTNTLIRAYTAIFTQGQQITFHFTTDGQAASAARAGLLRLRVRMVNNTGAPTAQYDVNSDGSANAYGTGTPFTLPTGFVVDAADIGYIRGTTTATVSTSNVAFGGAVPSKMAHPDTIYQRVTLGAQLYRTRTFTLGIGSVSGATNTTAGPAFDRNQGTVDTRFPAAANSLAQTVTVPNAGLVAIPATVLTLTAPAVSLDPRLTRTPLFQLDDNTFATPPFSKDKPDHRRLNTQIGYLGSATDNARGEGVNGVVYNVSLTSRKPGGSTTQTGLVTATRGGRAGMSPDLLPWNAPLPGGIWDKAVTITSPAGYTGGYVVQNGSTEYSLIARDPFVAAMVNVQHEPGHGGKHFTAGMALIPTCYLINIATGVRVPGASITSATIGLIRATAAANPDGTGAGWEYLDSTGAWNVWDPTEARHSFTMSQSTADSTTFERRFVTDATWGVRDVRVVVALEYEGVVYFHDLVVINVGPRNTHDGPPLDAVGYSGYPLRT